MLFDRGIVKQIMLYAYQKILLTNKKQWTLDVSLRNYAAQQKKKIYIYIYTHTTNGIVSII